MAGTKPLIKAVEDGTAMELEGIGLYRETINNLESTWHQVLESNSMRVCVIEGDSGMWKSRVVMQFVEKTQIPAVVTRASQLPGPYLPLRLAFDSMLQIKGVQAQLILPPNEVTLPWRIALTSLASAIPLLKPDPANAIYGDWTILEQWGMYRLPVIGNGDSDVEDSGKKSSEPLTLPSVFTEALGELARLDPLVLFVDDFDLCDSSTLDGIRLFVLPQLSQTPVLFIFALDNGPEESDLQEFMRSIDETYAPQRLTLHHLSGDEVKEIASTQFSSLTPDQAQVLGSIIHEATGGLMAEIEDTLQWVYETGEQVVLVNPQLIQHHDQLMKDQFGHLSDFERSVLKVASVQGRYFCAPVVASVLDTAVDRVVGVLTDLASRPNSWVRGDAVVQLGSHSIPWYRFRGRQRQEKTYEYVPSADKVRYHLLTGMALEALYRDHVESVAGLLALQFEKGSATEHAAQYYAFLANQANLQGDFASGAYLAQKGLDNLSDQEELYELRCRLAIEKGKALSHSERARLAISELENSFELASELGDNTLQIDASLYLGKLLIQRNRWDEGIDYLLQTLELARSHHNWTIVTAILEDLREPYFKRGRGNEFVDLCNRMIVETNEDRTPASRSATAEILEYIAWVEYSQAHFEKALAATDRALKALEALEQRDYYAEIFFKLHRRRAEVLERIDDFAGSLNEAELALSWARLSRQRRHQASSLQTKANVLQSLGRVDEGEQAYSDALRLMESSVDLSRLAQIEADFGLFLSQTGRKQRAKEIYEKAVEHSGMASDFRHKQVAQNNLASILKHTGEFSASMAIFRQLHSEALAQEIPDKSRQSLALNHMGDIMRIQNRLSEAENCHRQAIELAIEMNNLSRQAFSSRYLGQVLLARWANDEAEQAIGSAVKLQEQAHAVRMRHYSRVYLGRIMINTTKLNDALDILTDSDNAFRDRKNTDWEAIAKINLALCMLCSGEVSKALDVTEMALRAFSETESWRVNEAYHLLARCYLALGEFDKGRECIAHAKQGFMRLKLFHRVFQAENTEVNLENAQLSSGWQQWRLIGNDELRQDFNHLGV